MEVKVIELGFNIFMVLISVEEIKLVLLVNDRLYLESIREFNFKNY